MTTPQAKYKVSLADLNRRRACAWQKARFQHVFGEEAKKGVPVTKVNLERAYRGGLNLGWLLRKADAKSKNNGLTQMMTAKLNELTRELRLTDPAFYDKRREAELKAYIHVLKEAGYLP